MTVSSDRLDLLVQEWEGETPSPKETSVLLLGRWWEGRSFFVFAAQLPSTQSFLRAKWHIWVGIL